MEKNYQIEFTWQDVSYQGIVTPKVKDGQHNALLEELGEAIEKHVVE